MSQYVSTMSVCEGYQQAETCAVTDISLNKANCSQRSLSINVTGSVDDERERKQPFAFSPNSTMGVQIARPGILTSERLIMTQLGSRADNELLLDNIALAATNSMLAIPGSSAFNYNGGSDLTLTSKIAAVFLTNGQGVSCEQYINFGTLGKKLLQSRQNICLTFAMEVSTDVFPAAESYPFGNMYVSSAEDATYHLYKKILFYSIQGLLVPIGNVPLGGTDAYKFTIATPYLQPPKQTALTMQIYGNRATLYDGSTITNKYNFNLNLRGDAGFISPQSDTPGTEISIDASGRIAHGSSLTTGVISATLPQICLKGTNSNARLTVRNLKLTVSYIRQGEPQTDVDVKVYHYDFVHSATSTPATINLTLGADSIYTGTGLTDGTLYTSASSYYCGKTIGSTLVAVRLGGPFELNPVITGFYVPLQKSMITTEIAFSFDICCYYILERDLCKGFQTMFGNSMVTIPKMASLTVDPIVNDLALFMWEALTKLIEYTTPNVAPRTAAFYIVNTPLSIIMKKTMGSWENTLEPFLEGGLSYTLNGSFIDSWDQWCCLDFVESIFATIPANFNIRLPGLATVLIPAAPSGYETSNPCDFRIDVLKFQMGSNQTFQSVDSQGMTESSIACRIYSDFSIGGAGIMLKPITEVNDIYQLQLGMKMSLVNISARFNISDILDISISPMGLRNGIKLDPDSYDPGYVAATTNNMQALLNEFVLAVRRDVEFMAFQNNIDQELLLVTPHTNLPSFNAGIYSILYNGIISEGEPILAVPEDGSVSVISYQNMAGLKLRSILKL